MTGTDFDDPEQVEPEDDDVKELEDDPSQEPDDDALKDIKGG